MSDEEAPIPLRVANKKAYVWDVEGGTLPHLSQQNVFLGLPLVLLPEETVLLVELGAAVLIDDPSAHDKPSSAQLEKWNEEQKESIKTQIALMETKNAKENSERVLSEEALRKRREREEKRRALAQAQAAEAAAQESSEASLFGGDAPTPAVTITGVGPSASAAAVNPQASSASVPYTITVAGPSSSLDWYTPNPHSHSTIESARAAGIWDYPSNLQERAQCGVFRGLWEQGNYLGVGIKFGGEYLVYPGDPLRYHSHFVATVIESPTTTLRPMEIVAHGRLGTATKKSHLLCGWDDEKKEVSYLSIEWAGFG
ncbi:hypothetical protein EST38_g4726 [Candolleomyces aberdarensis]|uniref:tRNA-splicing endonuclease subunit Sen34 n=1 Tax=Candolleomyces aberdarensis TaxID=2316362 RepID=A0A4Q2DP63_9AGAR|nr:hypothetical protein EST38_g4726 [Candolleomyces aberdarensis]